MKSLHFAGELTGTELSRRLGLEFPVIAPALELLKGQHQIAIVGGGFVGGASYRYRITDAGRTRAALFLETSHYVGAAPVPLAQYQAYMNAYRAAAPRGATRERVRDAFRTSSSAIGSSISSDRRSMPAIRCSSTALPATARPSSRRRFTTCSTARSRFRTRSKSRATSSGCSIPSITKPSPADDDSDSLASRSNGDRRWVRCRRPMVMVGGELTLDALELSYNPTTGFYRAPVQAVANGGVLVIDDFGRQRCSPRDLLNRWIVPLESRVDFLTLQSGQKFELPFMTLIVFATNVRPAELVDEAFLRRIQYKIFAESPTVEDFKMIFASCCRDLGATAETGLVEQLLLEYYRPRKIALRGCHPRDLIKQALSLASYLNRPPHLTVRSHRSGVQQLLRQRSRGSRRLRLIRHADLARSHPAGAPGRVRAGLGRADRRAPSVRITSPLGRSGASGSIRIVAQIQPQPDVALGPVQFFVDGKLLQTDGDGAPYAVEWTDENPFERREIAVAVSDALGREVRDTIVLEPFDIVEEAQVTSVLVEASVQDRNGRFVKNIPPAAFSLLEDGAPQVLDLARHEAVGATFALLIDSSASMSRRLEFVQRTAAALADYMARATARSSRHSRRGCCP